VDIRVLPGDFEGPLTALGSGSFCVEVGGISVRFEGLPGGLLTAALERYGPFLCQTDHPLHTVHLACGRKSYLDMAEDRFLRLEEERSPEGRALTSHSFAAFRPARDLDRGILLLHPGTAEDPALGSLENYLRWVVADLALERGSFVLHAAGLVRDGRGYVFFGPSGAGKSTLAGMSVEMDDACGILSDDLVLIGRREGSFEVSSTPFAGTLPQSDKKPGAHPLVGLYRLKQAAHHALRPVEPLALAAATVLTCCPFVADASARRDRLMPLVESCCAAVPVQELSFLKNPGFWDIL
jgi:hypothetical protein